MKHQQNCHSKHNETGLVPWSWSPGVTQTSGQHTSKKVIQIPMEVFLYREIRHYLLYLQDSQRGELPPRPWTLDLAAWIQEPGSTSLDPRAWIQEPGSRFRTRSTKCANFHLSSSLFPLFSLFALNSYTKGTIFVTISINFRH